MKTSEEKIKNLAFQYLEKIQGNLLVLKPNMIQLKIYEK
jgi:hypothetical protein